MKRLAVMLVTLLVVACPLSVSRDDLPGTYIAKDGEVIQELRLEAGGAYVNTLYVKGSIQWVDTGLWDFEKHAGETGAIFSRFRFGMKDTSLSTGYWFVVPERSITGAIRLCYDPDLGRCFQLN